jgi:DHA2 family metal-tetracycline-proton antiporter-like MFS transporter
VAGLLTPAVAKPSTQRPLAALILICAAIFFGVLNASAVAVVLPLMGADLGVAPSNLSWVMTVFLLVYGVAIPFFGRLADLFGARRMLLLGIGLFATGSLLSALASNFTLLLSARIVQAAGGAAVPGLGMAIASRAYPAKSRGMVLGVIGAVLGAGGAIGPLLGGAVSTVWGWQAVFYLTAVSALAIPIGLRVLPREEERTPGRLDLAGGALLASTVVGLLLAVTEGPRAGWDAPLVLAGAIVAPVAFAGLVLRQRRSQDPFLPRELLGNSKYVAFVTTSLLLMAAFSAALVTLPTLLAAANGSTPFEVGLIMLPGAGSSAITGLLAGRLVDRAGARSLARVGSLLMLIGVGILSATAGGLPRGAVFGFGLVGAGFGLVNTPLATAISRVVRAQMLASALSVNSMLFFLGGSLGIAAMFGLSTWESAALNPLHTDSAVGFSNGFLLFLLPLLGMGLLVGKLPGAPDAQQPEAAAAGPGSGTFGWKGDCSVPWCPELHDHELVQAASDSPRPSRSH